LATIGDRTANALPSLRGVNHTPARIGNAIPVNDTTSVPNMASLPAFLVRHTLRPLRWRLQISLLPYYSVEARKNFREVRNLPAGRAQPFGRAVALSIPGIEIIL
jgi:hypothetical protein